MKGILISLLAACLSLLAAWGIVSFAEKRIKSGRRRSKKKKAAAVMLLWCGFFVIGGLGYFGNYYHSGSEAHRALESDDKVRVAEIERGYFFDGAGTECAYIFYPGAKVETSAYAPLMRRLAERGVDCFLLEMPLHMAFTDRMAAERIVHAYSYDSWYVGGHSLGGAMACFYAAAHHETVDGVILFASYPSQKLPDSLEFLSIAGSEDGVMKRGTYEENKVNWPADGVECIIEGGNHAGFGDYGKQARDHEARISAAEQQDQAAAAVLSLLELERS